MNVWTLNGGRSAFAAFVAISACSGPAAAQGEQEFDLPAQDLSVSLREVSLRTGHNLVAPSALVAGRRAPPLAGRFSAPRAVEILLRGSGLRVRAVGNALVVGSAAADGAAQPGSVGAVLHPGGEDEADTIVVTGTNLRGVAPSSPVITITRDEIERSAPSSVEQLMRQVPQNFQGGVNQENFAVTGAGADVTEHGAGLNLRGLGQRATLVLVNGRRLAPSGAGSFVDVSLIPISAVERVEILTDGASAIYGSDAVGGVVNFILRDRFDGLETVAQAGTSAGGAGDQLLAGMTAGQSWQDGRAMLSYEYRSDDEILARDRDYTINLDPDFSLFPRERRHSLFGVASQQLGEGLRAELSATFARRDSERVYFFGGTSIPVSAVADAQSFGFSGSLDFELGASWAVQLSGAWFESRTEQNQNQPEGQGLVNILDTRNSLREIAVKLDGDLAQLPGGAVKVAAGAQTRREAFSSLFETPVNAPNRESDSRNVHSLFAEAYIPLFSTLNRRPGLERLLVTAAVRYEDYDGLGGTFDPKVGLLWSPHRSLSLRASFDTSFRAPLISETIGNYNAFLFPAALLFINPSEAPMGVGAALVGSNPAIQPERSRTWTIGAEFTPAQGLSLKANYYSIRFSNRIALPTPQIVVVGDPALEPIVARNPSLQDVTAILGAAGQVLDFSGPGFTDGNAAPEDILVIVDARFNNTAVTTTSGLDLGLRYDFRLGANRFIADLYANHIFAFRDRLTSASPEADVLNTPYRPVGWRARGGLAWSNAGWSGSLFANHSAGYRDNRATVVRRVGSFTTLDAGLAYAFEDAFRGWLRGTRISLNAQNLFNKAPPRLLPDPGFTRGVGYDPVNATARGRLLAVQVRKRW